mgnify:CR=1 FL=1
MRATSSQLPANRATSPSSPSKYASPPAHPLQARGEAAKVAAALSAELAALDAALLPLLLPALQAYTRVSAAAGTCRALPQSEWQAAEAAACGDMLQLFVTAGSVAAAASVSGRRASGALARWMGGGQEGGPAAEAWQLLSQHAAVTLRGADRPFLLAAVDRANAGMDATGRDGARGSRAGEDRGRVCKA